MSLSRFIYLCGTDARLKCGVRAVGGEVESGWKASTSQPESKRKRRSGLYLSFVEEQA
jgi:hypothetical protein